MWTGNGLELSEWQSVKSGARSTASSIVQSLLSPLAAESHLGPDFTVIVAHMEISEVEAQFEDT